jgi:hypothetical protein
MKPYDKRKVFGSLETEWMMGLAIMDDDVDGDIDFIKLKISSFQGKNNFTGYLE